MRLLCVLCPLAKIIRKSISSVDSFSGYESFNTTIKCYLCPRLRLGEIGLVLPIGYSHIVYLAVDKQSNSIAGLQVYYVSFESSGLSLSSLQHNVSSEAVYWIYAFVNNFSNGHYIEYRTYNRLHLNHYATHAIHSIRDCILYCTKSFSNSKI